MDRREFLGKSIAGAGLALTAGFASPKPKSEFFDPYEMLNFGRTGIKVSRIGMGTGMKGWNGESNQTRLGNEKFHALIRAAYDRGIRIFDLADIYGTHSHIIPALKQIPREKFVIITKLWFGPGGLLDEERPNADIVVQRFLKELGTDYIDILLLHCCKSADWPTEQSDHMTRLDKMKTKGIIRAHGVSCHSLDALKAAAAEPWVDSVNARINPYGVIMDDTPEKVSAVIRKIHNASKGVVGMKIIGAGQFRSSDEMRNNSVRFALNLGCVDVLNVGFEKTQEIDDLAARISRVPRYIKV